MSGYYYDESYARALEHQRALEQQRQREQRAYEQQRAIELGRRVGQLEFAMEALGQYAENQVHEAQNRARLEQWKRDQERIAKPAVSAANDPNNPKNWPKVGFNTEVKKDFVMSPGATVRSR